MMGLRGWDQVVSLFPGEFSSMDVAWPDKATFDRENHISLAGIVPAYTMNVTQVWPSDVDLRPTTSLERTREQ
jgi:hypothetical protein